MERPLQLHLADLFHNAVDGNFTHKLKLLVPIAIWDVSSDTINGQSQTKMQVK